ncbi:MAG: Fpg/Nei family DNA glycosylase [Corynebacterium sp.]|uniref:DNA-formamidopyrimidine glycosylase family protein n=1 Tax=Corynebacterium sp. TaxID=1720 RepID=UPI0026DD1832|nr:DNA-formamidopyrimidine glycosylase family protein [Corynebacterium sp.]MDO5097321.1 Fpg/Nei family DNA glycosylase [Corynebacterium sp.]
MPEGDSIFQLAHRLQFMVGREVLGTDIRVPRFATVDFTATTCTRVWPYGKHLFMQFGSTILHTHLKMEGSWSMHRLGAKWRKPGHTARVVLRLADAAGPIELVGHSLGFVRVFPAIEYANHIAHLGPDILSPDWPDSGAAEALRRITAVPDRTIGTALLDQRNVAGIGNEYRAEICFIAGIHPATVVADTDVAAVLGIGRKLMWANRMSPLRVTTGVRRAGESAYVFGRNGKPCRRCGTSIKKGELGGDYNDLERIIWWCPHCQPQQGLGPADL